MLPKPVEHLVEKQLAAAPSASARGVGIDSLKSFIDFDFRVRRVCAASLPRTAEERRTCRVFNSRARARYVCVDT